MQKEITNWRDNLDDAMQIMDCETRKTMGSFNPTWVDKI